MKLYLIKQISVASTMYINCKNITLTQFTSVLDIQVLNKIYG